MSRVSANNPAGNAEAPLNFCWNRGVTKYPLSYRTAEGKWVLCCSTDRAWSRTPYINWREAIPVYCLMMRVMALAIADVFCKLRDSKLCCYRVIRHACPFNLSQRFFRIAGAVSPNQQLLCSNFHRSSAWQLANRFSTQPAHLPNVPKAFTM